jgi:hypothetical protein
VLEVAAGFHLAGETRFSAKLRNREKVLGTTLDYPRLANGFSDL